MGKSSSPKVPDYAAQAEATSQGNLDLARYATQANRPNEITPYGTRTWTNDASFNQAGYDAAMQAYNQQMQAVQNLQAQRPQYSNPNGNGESGGWNGSNDFGSAYGGSTVNPRNLQLPEAPKYEDFMNPAGNWTSTTTLSPEMQALFDQQNRIQQGLFGAQGQALDRVNATMGQGFDLSRLPAQGSVLNTSALPGYQGYGDVLDMGSLPGYGDVLNMNSLPGFGQVLDINGLPQAGTAFTPTGEQLATYDPTLNTNNATELLMQRMNPELDRQQEALRTQLANQGIAMGSQAYDQAMSQFGQQRNDAASQAALQGIGLGMQQQGLQFNQGLQNRQLIAGEQAQGFSQQNYLRELAAQLQGQRFGQQTTNQQLAGQLQNQRFGQQTTNQQLAAALQAQRFGQQTTNQQLSAQQRALEAQLQAQRYGQQNQNRQMSLQEQAYLRSLPMNELNALMSGTQVQQPQFGGFSQQGQVAGPDYMQAANATYNAQLGNANAQNAGSSNFIGGLFGMGGSLLGTEAGAGWIKGLFS